MIVRCLPRSSLLAALILPLMLGACQSMEQPAGQDLAPGEEAIKVLADRHEAQVNARDTFEVSGGLGIWTDDESLSARITWLQAPETLHLKLEGPLGFGTMQLEDAAGLATLSRGGQTIAQGGNADTVLQQGLGLAAPVPVHELASWIRGLPGNASRVKRDAQGKLSSLQFTDEQGTYWQARFRRYTDWEGVPVPSLITASGGPYSVRVLLKNWGYATTTVVPETPESNNRLPIPGR